MVIDKVVHRESCHHMSLTIVGDPLSDLIRMQCNHLAIVSHIVFFIPVFHFGCEKCLRENLRTHTFDPRSRCEEFLARSLRSVVP